MKKERKKTASSKRAKILPSKKNKPLVKPERPEDPTRRYSGEYDAYYNAYTNEWLEASCHDINCMFCVNRPARPLDVAESPPTTPPGRS